MTKSGGKTATTGSFAATWEWIVTRVGLVSTLGFWHQHLPITSWLPLYRTQDLLGDVIAGITAALTIIPQGIGYAPLSGLPVQYGLYACIMPGLVYSLFGTTKEVSIGPTAINSMMSYDFAGASPHRAATLGFLSGLTEVVMGVLNLGFLMKYVSSPVMSAFGSAIGVQVVTYQVRELFGLTFPATSFLGIWWGFFTHLPSAHPPDVLAGLVSLLVIFCLTNQKNLTCLLGGDPTAVQARVVGKCQWLVSTAANCTIVIIGIIVAALTSPDSPVTDSMLTTNTSYYPPLEGEGANLPRDGEGANLILEEESSITWSRGLTLTGPVDGGLPPFDLPWHIGLNESEAENVIFWDIVQSLDSGYILVAVVSILNSLAISQHYAGSRQVDSSQEMIALGLSQAFSSFTGALPVTAAFGRGAVNSSSGVRSPLAGAVTGGILLASAYFLSPYLALIPIPVLSAVLIYSSFSTVSYKLPVTLWKTNKLDLAPCLLTFFLGILYRVETGLMAGSLMHCLILLYYTTRVEIEVTAGCDHTVVRVCHSLYYPCLDSLRRDLNRAAEESTHNIIILDLMAVAGVDYSAALALLGTINTIGKKRTVLVCCTPGGNTETCLTHPQVAASAGAPAHSLNILHTLEEAVLQAPTRNSSLTEISTLQ